MSLEPERAGRDPGLWIAPQGWRAIERRIAGAFLMGCALVTVLTTIGIVIVLGTETIAFFRAGEVNPWRFLVGIEPEFDRLPIPEMSGILPLIWGTLVVAVGSSVVALPIGLLSAIFLSEYAPPRLRAVLKPTLELLAGVPTIVYGYLALLLVTPALQAIFRPLGLEVGIFNALSACLVVGIMIIPMVSSLSEDVLSSVPRALREGGYALGATRFEVATRIVLPAGLSGVLASFILAISRAIGETMAVVLAAGSVPNVSPNLLESVETMTAYIVQVIGGESAPNSPERLSLYAVGMVLFLFTLGLNVASGAILRRYREVYH
ncbi:MAG: phosphate ABC transporter permease subunit PstC [Isosphaeraceae bacterium]